MSTAEAADPEIVGILAEIVEATAAIREARSTKVWADAVSARRDIVRRSGIDPSLIRVAMGEGDR